MENANILEEQIKIKHKIKYNEPMNQHTTFKIGGPAEYFVQIESTEDLKEVIKKANKNQIPITIIGNGSNILVTDKGIKGITLKIEIKKIEQQGKDEKANMQIGENKNLEVIVGAGEKLGKLAQYCLKEGITGFEELSGIPGTIGGAIKMNAGAHGKEMKDIVKSVKCIDYEGNEKEFTKDELEFDYRSSIFKKQRYIIVEATLELKKLLKENTEEIKQKMQRYKTYRKEKQPIEFPSAGSTFKRGNDFVTAKLIEEAGLKGYSIGGAQISTKHSGFIINKGNATAKDVLELVKYIKDIIYKKFNKKLELEIEIIGEQN